MALKRYALLMIAAFSAAFLFATPASAQVATNKIRLMDGTSASVGRILTATDGQAQTNGLDVNTFLLGYNGTTWDRLRTTSGVNAGILETALCDPSTAGRCIAVNASGQITVSNPFSLPLSGGATAVAFAPSQGLAIFGSNGTTLDALQEKNGGQLLTELADGGGTNVASILQWASTDANTIIGFAHPLFTGSIPYLVDGTTLDRARDTKAFTGTNVGIVASGICDPSASNCVAVNASGQLSVNCAAGCSGGGGSAPFTGGASGVATAVNQSIGLVEYNGLTMDSVQGDKSSAGASGAINVAGGGQHKTILTASSATACTSLETVTSGNTGRLTKVINTGAAQTVFLQLYDEGASPTCAAADDIYGDGTTIALGAGQILTLDIPLTNGLAYKISAALGANVIITRN